MGHNELVDELQNPNRVPYDVHWKDNVPQGISSTEIAKIYRENSALRARKHIAEFVEINKLRVDAITINQRTVLALSTEQFHEPIPTELVHSIIEQSLKVGKRQIIRKCFDVANDACKEQNFTGRLAASEGCNQSFVGWGNHCINWQELDDDSVMAFDLTATLNIDHQTGKIDVLSLRAKNLDELFARLHELYGGQWEVIELD